MTSVNPTEMALTLLGPPLHLPLDATQGGGAATCCGFVPLLVPNVSISEGTQLAPQQVTGILDVSQCFHYAEMEKVCLNLV